MAYRPGDLIGLETGDRICFASNTQLSDHGRAVKLTRYYADVVNANVTEHKEIRVAVRGWRLDTSKARKRPLPAFLQIHPFNFKMRCLENAWGVIGIDRHGEWIAVSRATDNGRCLPGQRYRVLGIPDTLPYDALSLGDTLQLKVDEDLFPMEHYVQAKVLGGGSGMLARSEFTGEIVDLTAKEVTLEQVSDDMKEASFQPQRPGFGGPWGFVYAPYIPVFMINPLENIAFTYAFPPLAENITFTYSITGGETGRFVQGDPVQSGSIPTSHEPRSPIAEADHRSIAAHIRSWINCLRTWSGWSGSGLLDEAQPPPSDPQSPPRLAPGVCLHANDPTECPACSDRHFRSIAEALAYAAATPEGTDFPQAMRPTFEPPAPAPLTSDVLEDFRARLQAGVEFMATDQSMQTNLGEDYYEVLTDHDAMGRPAEPALHEEIMGDLPSQEELEAAGWVAHHPVNGDVDMEALAGHPPSLADVLPVLPMEGYPAGTVVPAGYTARVDAETAFHEDPTPADALVGYKGDEMRFAATPPVRITVPRSYLKLARRARVRAIHHFSCPTERDAHALIELFPSSEAEQWRVKRCAAHGFERAHDVPLPV